MRTTLWREASAALLLVLSGCGHVVAPNIPFEGGPRFDFKKPPPCEGLSAPVEVPEGSVAVRYLGAGGLYVGWRGEGLLAGPFFSNPGYLRTAFGKIRPKNEAVRRGLGQIPKDQVGAVLAGHSHYDHIGDLEAVAEELGPRPAFYLNRSGVIALGDALTQGRWSAQRVRTLDDLVGDEEEETWIGLRDAEGRELPFRILPVPSHHAPHLGPIKLWQGTTEAGKQTLRHRHLKEGRTYAFVIELLGPKSEGSPVRFRIFYQDSAAREPHGIPSEPEENKRRYDLAMVCLASAHFVKPYPEGLLQAIEPHHVLVTHYENFFRPWDEPRGFAPFLFRRHADRFLETVEGVLRGQEIDGRPPGHKTCGPSSARWTLPLPGEWLVFRPSELPDTPHR